MTMRIRRHHDDDDDDADDDAEEDTISSRSTRCGVAHRGAARRKGGEEKRLTELYSQTIQGF